MNRSILTLFAWLLFAELALGEAVAVITGPDESRAGAMFVLDAKDSTGEIHVWVPPEIVGENNIQCGSRFATSISKPGTYEFMLIMADKDPSISYAKHTVVVGGGSPEPDEPSEPDPPSPDDPSFGSVRRASKDAAAKTSDAATIKHMIASLDVAIPKLGGMTEGEARKSVGYVIEGVLLARKGQSRDADWLTWRKEVDIAVGAADPRTVSQYADAVAAINSGLRDAESVLASKRKELHYYTSDTCNICVKWERNVLPHLNLDARGITLVTHKSNHDEPLVPVFVYGERRHVGYMSIADFETLARI